MPNRCACCSDELARGFDCEKAILVFRDAELERIFVWTVHAGQIRAHRAGKRPVGREPTLSCSIVPKPRSAGTQMDGAGAGLRLEPARRPPLAELPRLPGERAARHLGVRSLLSVTLDFGGQPVGRILLGNGRRRFLPQDLQWFERVVRHLGPPLENLFLLRHMRTRAIEGERSRISRDIHDGILQTLLSVDIQLDVLRRKVAAGARAGGRGPGDAAADRAQRDQELRRMVTDMRPLGVQSADLVDLMRGFAERFRNESGLALDLIIDAADAAGTRPHLPRAVPDIPRSTYTT